MHGAAVTQDARLDIPGFGPQVLGQETGLLAPALLCNLEEWRRGRRISLLPAVLPAATPR